MPGLERLVPGGLRRLKTEPVSAGCSRRQFLSAVAMTASAAILLRSRLGWAADKTDPRVADIVAKTIGIDTHNHIDVPLTAAETPGRRVEAVGPLSHLHDLCD